jgi:WD40 repeat protein
MALSRDGRTLATHDHKRGVVLWDSTTGEKRSGFAAEPAWMKTMAFSPDGKTLASSGSYAIEMWDTATGRPLLTDSAHREGVTGLDVSPDGRTVASCSDDGSVRTWDPRTGKERRRFVESFGTVFAVAYSPDGKTLAAANETVWLWDAETGKDQRRWADDLIDAIAFSGDGKRLVTHNVQGLLQVHDLDTKKKRRLDVPGAIGRPTPMAVMPKTSTLLVGTGKNRLALFDLATGESVPQEIVPEGALRFLTCSKDGRWLALLESGGFVRIWERATMRKTVRFRKGSEGCVFSPDGRTLALYGRDYEVRLFETATGEERCRFSGHTGGVNEVRFTPDGRYLISGSDDTTILVWDVLQKPPLGAPTARMLAAWCDDLGEEPAVAGRAIASLCAAPYFAPAALLEVVDGAFPGDARRIARFIKDLDSDEFSERQEAERRLRELAEAAEPAMRRELARDPSPEVKRRLEPLVQELEWPEWTPERLRALRAIEALEHLGSQDARGALERIARTTPAGWLRREARVALEHLLHRGERRERKERPKN